MQLKIDEFQDCKQHHRFTKILSGTLEVSCLRKMDEKLGLLLVVEMSLHYKSVVRIVCLLKTVLLIG